MLVFTLTLCSFMSSLVFAQYDLTIEQYAPAAAPGTEYSVESGQCLVVEGCTDFNDDGCTGTQDLLHLLSNFGNCDE